MSLKRGSTNLNDASLKEFADDIKESDEAILDEDIPPHSFKLGMYQTSLIDLENITTIGILFKPVAFSESMHFISQESTRADIGLSKNLCSVKGGKFGIFFFVILYNPLLSYNTSRYN